MVKGRQGFALEVWKFGVYLMIPVGASIYWNNTDRQKQNADYWQFIKYPPSDPEKVREEVQARIEREKRVEDQRKAYRDQMRILQESADRSRRNAAAVETEQSISSNPQIKNSQKEGGLWGWIGFGTKKTE